MIAKISSNSSLFGTLLYNKNKIDKDEATLLFSNNVYERRDGLFTMGTTIRSFEPYLAANRKTENPVFHVSLNPSTKDILSDDEYIDIAGRYMQDMGYGNQPYVVFKHTDIDRTHLHVVSVRVDETGKKLDSNFEKIRSMKICRQIEIDYNLHPATKQEQQSYAIPTKPLNYKQGDVKRQVGNIAKAILNNYSFQSIGEYNILLEKMNVMVEEVKGTRNNIPYHGLVYSPLDNGKKKIGTPFKSSLFGKDVNLQALDIHFQKSKQQIVNNKTREYLRPIITKAMQEADSMDGFSLLLKEKNIEPVFRRNDQNRIYGITFIDYQNKAVLNGSRLGKEFSANVFNDLFNNKPEQALDISSVPDNDMSVYPEQETDSATSLFPSLFEQHGTNIEEENFAKRKQKKKKRGLGW